MQATTDDFLLIAVGQHLFALGQVVHSNRLHVTLSIKVVEFDLSRYLKAPKLEAMDMDWNAMRG